MNPKAMLTSSRHQLAHENHSLSYLFYRYIIILDTLKSFLHLIKLMIMCSKKSLSPCFRILVNILHNSPCNTNTVVSTCPPAKLINKNKTSVRQVIHNIGSLIHLNHKS